MFSFICRAFNLFRLSCALYDRRQLPKTQFEKYRRFDFDKFEFVFFFILILSQEFQDEFN